ncbi:hypothetical protein EU537_08900 [Candidatus Thorarchaeota archaeon]|nr:MAG: hypothetical protein EU537_08900 [Candidatus Thorarchaeota archaeon]
MTEEKSNLWIVWVMRILGVLILTAIPSFGLLYLIMLAGIVPTDWVELTMLVGGLAFLYGAGVLIGSQNVKAWLYSWGVGFIIGIGAIIAGWLLWLSFIPIPVVGTGLNAFLLGAGACGALGGYLYLQTQGKQQGTLPVPISTSSKTRVSAPLSLTSIFRKTELVVAAVRVETVPHTLIAKEQDPVERKKRTVAIHSIVRQMILSSVPVAIRYETRGEFIRLLFLTWADDAETIEQYLKTLENTLTANLPEFGFTVDNPYRGFVLPENKSGSLWNAAGIPQPLDEEVPRSSILDGAVSLLKNTENCNIQIFAVPASVSSKSIDSLKREYEAAVERSHTTISKEKDSLFSGRSQESKTLIDAEAKRESERLEREIKRLSNKHLARTSVTVTCWNSEIDIADQRARRLMGALLGGARPQSEEDEFTVDAKTKRKDVANVLKGLPPKEGTLLTPEEVASYFVLPEVDLGIPVVKRERFSQAAVESVPAPKATHMRNSAKTRAGVKWRRIGNKIYLGKHMDIRGEEFDDIVSWLPPNGLDSHLGIYGNTRSGKTSSALSIIAQAIDLGIIPVVLVPYKPQDWRQLLQIFEELRIFTAGNPKVAPFRLNPFNVPDGVPLNKWISRIVTAFSASMPNGGTLEMHTKRMIRTAYGNCGWDPKNETKGRPVLLTDLVDAVLDVRKRTPYGEELQADMYGALVSRIESMLTNPVIVDMFNTSKGISFAELLSKPTIVEMDALSKEDRIFLSGILASGISEYKQAHPTKVVRHLLVLEEAHNLLRNASSHQIDAPQMQNETSLAFVEMFRVAGGTGLGLVMLEQLPGELVREAVKLPVNTICHALNSEYERTLVGKHMGLTDGQIEHIAGMKKGEAVVFTEHYRQAKNCRFVKLEGFFVEKLPSVPITNEMVYDAMETVYEKHPHWNEFTPLPDDIFERLIMKNTVETAPEPIVGTRAATKPTTANKKLETILRTDGFEEIWRVRVALAQEGEPDALVSLVRKALETTKIDQASRLDKAITFVSLAREVYGVPESKSGLKQILLSIVDGFS